MNKQLFALLIGATLLLGVISTTVTHAVAEDSKVMKSKKTETKNIVKKDTKTTKPKKAESKESGAGMHGTKFLSGTATSVQDPGVGHETHQLAVILPPSDKVYHGILTYSASENIQLVALHGPLKAGEDKGQATWSPDGKTKFALTFIDPANAMGTWEFSGNAIAVHTKNTTPFTVSYSVDAGQ